MQAGRPVLFWFCSGLVWSLVWFGFRFESGFGSVLGPGAVCGSWGRGTRVVGAVMCLYISWNDRNWIKFMRFARRRWNRIGSPHGPESETRKKKWKLYVYIGGRKSTFHLTSPAVAILGFEICAKVVWCLLAAKCFPFDAIFQKSWQWLSVFVG